MSDLPDEVVDGKPGPMNFGLGELDHRDEYDPDRVLGTVAELAEDGARTDIAKFARGSAYRGLFALYVDALDAMRVKPVRSGQLGLFDERGDK